jgi:hypothetical protein
VDEEMDAAAPFAVAMARTFLPSLNCKNQAILSSEQIRVFL